MTSPGHAAPTTARSTRAEQGPMPVLVIGQVPPPYGGQNIMTQILVSGRYPHARILHVDAAFSTSLADMGTASFRKARQLVKVLAQALWTTLRRRPRVLYYHPAGASTSAVVRDIVLLLSLRPFYRTVVFHLHARGLVEAFLGLPAPLRALARRAYAAPEMLLGPSDAVVREAAALGAGRALVVPNGVPGGTPRTGYDADGPLEILFLNLVSEAKGAGWLLEGLGELVRRGVDVRLTYVGELYSAEFHRALLDRADELGVSDRVEFPGLAIGPDKWRRMSAADIFCVPTTWNQESFGLALVEAASCGLPVVAADVPGVREVLERDVSVLLADPARPESLADHLEQLCRAAPERERLGRAARAAYLDRYTQEAYWHRIDGVFETIMADRRA